MLAPPAPPACIGPGLHLLGQGRAGLLPRALRGAAVMLLRRSGDGGPGGFGDHGGALRRSPDRAHRLGLGGGGGAAAGRPDPARLQRHRRDGAAVGPANRRCGRRILDRAQERGPRTRPASPKTTARSCGVAPGNWRRHTTASPSSCRQASSMETPMSATSSATATGGRCSWIWTTSRSDRASGAAVLDVQGRGPRSEHRLDGPHVAGLGAGPRKRPAGAQLGSVGGGIAVRFATLRAGAICLRGDPRLAWPRVVIAILPTPWGWV
jgi:hypothetical protein